jgi:hypothetical protein
MQEPPLAVFQFVRWNHYRLPLDDDFVIHLIRRADDFGLIFILAKAVNGFRAPGGNGTEGCVEFPRSRVPYFARIRRERSAERSIRSREL